MLFRASRLNSAFHLHAEAQGKEDSSPTLGHPAPKLGADGVSRALVWPDGDAEAAGKAGGRRRLSPVLH